MKNVLANVLALLLVLVLPACSTNGDLFVGKDQSPLMDGAAPDLGNPALAPVPVIFHPGNNETRPAGTSIPFVGHANDPTDGALTGAALVWTSDRDGKFGTGETFSAILSSNVHVVTLTATDSLGLSASVVITTTVN